MGGIQADGTVRIRDMLAKGSTLNDKKGITRRK